MRKFQETRAITAFTLGIGLGLAPVAIMAQTEIFESMTNERCSEESRDTVAEAARLNVESHVTRAEASIQPPTPVGDLSCLNDLMNIDIDYLSGQFFSLDSLLGDFTSGLQTITLESIGEEVNRQICAFAEEKWAELTEPLTLLPGDLLGDVSPDFTSNFALINLSEDSSGSGGSGGVTAAPPSVTTPAQSATGPDVEEMINQIYNSLNGEN